MLKLNLSIFLACLIIGTIVCAKEKSSIIADNLKELSRAKNANEVDFHKIVDKSFNCLFIVDKNANDSLHRYIKYFVVKNSISELEENDLLVILVNKNNEVVYSEILKNPAITVPFTYRNRMYCTDEYKFGLWTNKAETRKFILPIKKTKSDK